MKWQKVGMSDERTTEAESAENTASFDDNSDEFDAVELEMKAKDGETDASEAEKEADRKMRSESYKIMASAGNFGLFLVIAVFFGWFIGSGMDKLFGIKPVFTVFWIVAAVAASILELVRSIKAAKKLGEESDKGASSDV